jgi:hypothetical protein
MPRRHAAGCVVDVCLAHGPGCRHVTLPSGFEQHVAVLVVTPDVVAARDAARKAQGDAHG